MLGKTVDTEEKYNHLQAQGFITLRRAVHGNESNTSAPALTLRSIKSGGIRADKYMQRRALLGGLMRLCMK